MNTTQLLKASVKLEKRLNELDAEHTRLIKRAEEIKAEAAQLRSMKDKYRPSC